MNVLTIVTGLVIIGFISLMMIYAMPSVHGVLKTGAGTTWENSSAVVVNAVQFTDSVAVLLPALVFIFGLVILIVGD